jgi:hypothetical protein
VSIFAKQTDKDASKIRLETEKVRWNLRSGAALYDLRCADTFRSRYASLQAVSADFGFVWPYKSHGVKVYVPWN